MTETGPAGHKNARANPAFAAAFRDALIIIIPEITEGEYEMMIFNGNGENLIDAPARVRLSADTGQ